METPVEGIPSEGTGDNEATDSVTTSMHPARTAEGMRPNKQCFQSKAHSEQSEELFPRLPDEITFSRIVPKLPWRAFHVLAAVSRTWRKAIQDHCVHDARIRSCSSDTLVVHGHDYKTGDYQIDGAKCSQRIAVHSFRDKLCYDLPPIPGHSRGVPVSCQCVSLDGKIYVLGGDVDIHANAAWGSNGSSKVYALDLAGAGHWKECASMERGRRNFGCAVLNGKIYVFGGSSNGGPVRGAEVYNPKVNTWSPIAPMISLGFDCTVSTMAQEFFVHSGSYYHPSYLCWKANGGWSFKLKFAHYPVPICFMRETLSVEAYNPMKDEWTVHRSLGKLEAVSRGLGSLFVAKGKFHWMQEGDMPLLRDDESWNISVLEDDGSWTHRKQNEFVGSGRRMTVERIVAVELKNELLAAIEWLDDVDESDDEDGESRRIRQGICYSEGFNSENRNMIWNVISRCPMVVYYMHCIQV